MDSIWIWLANLIFILAVVVGIAKFLSYMWANYVSSWGWQGRGKLVLILYVVFTAISGYSGLTNLFHPDPFHQWYGGIAGTIVFIWLSYIGLTAIWNVYISES